MAEIQIVVECYAGYRYPERPLAFQIRDQNYRVERLVDRWYGEDTYYFKVLAHDHRVYLLGYRPGQDVWTLRGMFPLQGHLSVLTLKEGRNSAD
jgi:hypothetical protein